MPVYSVNLIGFFEDLLETGRVLDCLFWGGEGEGGEFDDISHNSELKQRKR